MQGLYLKESAKEVGIRGDTHTRSPPRRVLKGRGSENDTLSEMTTGISSLSGDLRIWPNYTMATAVWLEPQAR